MLKNYIYEATCVCILLLATLTHARYLDDEEESTRIKRQVAESQLSHILALLELEGRLDGCREVGCGLLDFSRFLKRSWSDQRLAELKAEIALQGRGDPDFLFGHGIIDPRRQLIKRTSSDQRFAELMALIALSRGGGVIGHGRINPDAIGRRKRSAQTLNNGQEKTFFKHLMKNTQQASRS